MVNAVLWKNNGEITINLGDTGAAVVPISDSVVRLVLRPDAGRGRGRFLGARCGCPGCPRRDARASPGTVGIVTADTC